MTSSRRQVGVSAVTVAFAITLAACSGSNIPVEQVGATSSALTPIVGCDYSGNGPSVATLQSDGFRFVGLFFTGDPKATISASQLKPLMSVGIDVVLGWEGSAAEANSTSLGLTDGEADAKNALAQATALGVPSNRPIYFAISIDPNATQIPNVEQYFTGVAKVLNPDRIGVFGDYTIVDDILTKKLATWGWQTSEFSSGKWASGAHLHQVQTGVGSDDGLNKDESDGAVDFGQWGPNSFTAAPTGTFNTPSCTTISGTAEDTGDPGAAITVVLSFDAAAGAPGNHEYQVATNKSHEFSMDTPRGLMDGKTHDVYAYAKNLVADKPNVLLGGKPKTIKCEPPVISGAYLKRLIPNTASLTKWKLNTFLNTAPYSAAAVNKVTLGEQFDLAPATVPGVSLTGKTPPVLRLQTVNSDYVVDGPYLRPIANGSTFASWRFQQKAQTTVQLPDLESIVATSDDPPPWPAKPLLIQNPPDVNIYVLDVHLPALVHITPPTTSTSPVGVTFPGGTFGGSCTGDVYIPVGAGYAFCDNGTWAYTTMDPGADGYIPLSPDGGVPAGGGDPFDAGTLTFQDGSIVVDGQAAQEPQPIDDGGPLVDGEVPNGSGGGGGDSGFNEGDAAEYGAPGAPQNWSSGCSVAHGEGSQDPTWLLLVAAGVVVSVKRRRSA